MYGFMLLVFIILAIVTVCVTIVGTYFLLNAENYHWQWTSFSAAASTSLCALLPLSHPMFALVLSVAMDGTAARFCRTDRGELIRFQQWFCHFLCHSRRHAKHELVAVALRKVRCGSLNRRLCLQVCIHVCRALLLCQDKDVGLLSGLQLHTDCMHSSMSQMIIWFSVSSLTEDAPCCSLASQSGCHICMHKCHCTLSLAIALTQTTFYFGYTLTLCLGLAIMEGALGYIGASVFVRRIFRTIKAD